MKSLKGKRSIGVVEKLPKACEWGVSEIIVSDPVPVPSAVWLSGSGLSGLAGVAHRKIRQ